MYYSTIAFVILQSYLTSLINVRNIIRGTFSTIEYSLCMHPPLKIHPFSARYRIQHMYTVTTSSCLLANYSHGTTVAMVMHQTKYLCHNNNINTLYTSFWS